MAQFLVMKKCLFLWLAGFLLTAPSFADGQRDTVDNFYRWYLSQGSNYRENWSEAESFFEPRFYQLFEKGFKLQPEDGRFVDYDPFIDAQVDAKKVRSTPAVKVSENLSLVKVFPSFRNMSAEGPPLKIYLRKLHGQWKIANILTTGEGTTNTKDYLVDIVERWGEGAAENDPSRWSAQGQGEDPSTMLSLEEVLPGTWNYISDSPTKDGIFKPVEPAKLYWKLNADGSGTYYRKINQFNAPMVHDKLRWSIKGKTLTMDGDLHYTVIEWGESWMIWRNPSGSTYFRVEKE